MIVGPISLLDTLLLEFEWTDSKTRISLLVFYSLLITLSPLFLHNELHLALCMFDHCGLYLKRGRRDVRRPTEGVLARADFVNIGER